MRWAIRSLAVVALLLSAYLAWSSWGQGTVAGCGGGEQIDCDHVLASHWAHWLGVPVAVGGLACYTLLFAASCLLTARSDRLRAFATRSVLLLSVVAGGAAVWFIGLQWFAIGKLCTFCMFVHAMGLTLAGIAIGWTTSYSIRSRGGQRQVSALRSSLSVSTKTQPPPAPPAPTSDRHGHWLAIAGGVAGILLLIGGQLLFPGKSYVVETFAARNDQVHSNPQADDVEAPEMSGTADATRHVVHRIDPNSGAKEALAAATASNELTDTKASADDESTTAQQEPSSGADSDKPRRIVELADGNLVIDLYEQALLGSPDAPYVIVELMDYTCDHCRMLNTVVKEALPRFDDQIVMVILPVPLDADCNRYIEKTHRSHRDACELAHLMLAVADLDPYVFRDMHEWLLDADGRPKRFEQALARANRLLGRSRIARAMENEDYTARLRANIEFFVQVKKQQPYAALPIQIIGDKFLAGKVDTADELCEVWREKLGIDASQ